MRRVLTAEHRIRSNPEACLVLSLEGGTADGGACVARESTEQSRSQGQISGVKDHNEEGKRWK